MVGERAALRLARAAAADPALHANAPIPLCVPYHAPGTLERLTKVLESDHLHGDGPFTRSATSRLRALTGGGEALLTTSGTHALEMASHLLELGPGDEVVLPSFTFPSAAAAVVARGARPVFVDVDPRTGNIDLDQVPEAITPRTRAISIVHYGGMPVDLGVLESITSEAGIPIIEDNAHGLGVVAGERMLGRSGVLGVQSFHDTKNIQCGEGGALLLGDARLRERAEIMREKGTNRAQFLRGEVDRYSWVAWGSSYLPSELNAAVLDAQLAAFDDIQAQRHRIWNAYRDGLADWASHAGVSLMDPPGGVHAAHLFVVRMPDAAAQTAMIAHLRAAGVSAAFHYVPLHSSAAGRRYGRSLRRRLARADELASRLVRLPLWPGMTDGQIERVTDAVASWRPDARRPCSHQEEPVQQARVVRVHKHEEHHRVEQQVHGDHVGE